MISDTFDRANGALGANWANAESGAMPTIDGNAALGGVGGAYSAAYYSGSSWNDEHSSLVVIGAVLLYGGPGVRMSAGDNWIHWLDDGSITQSVAGVETSLATRGAPIVAGDILKLTVSGVTLTPNKNGSDLATITLDGVLTGGAPGIIFYGNVAKLDSWEGTGEVGGGGPTPPPFASSPYAMRIR